MTGVARTRTEYTRPYLQMELENRKVEEPFCCGPRPATVSVTNVTKTNSDRNGPILIVSAALSSQSHGGLLTNQIIFEII